MRKSTSIRAALSLSTLLLAIMIWTEVESKGQSSPIQGWRAGAARTNITPREPLPMWGYGARHDALSTGMLDPLYADALVLEAGGEKIALVGLDLGRSPSESSLQHIRERIRAEAGIKYSLIAGSHTHHGPVLELTDQPGKGKGRFDAAIRYYQEMEDNIVAAILEADRQRVEARILSGSIQLTGFNRNRHTKIEPKPSDRELGLLRVEDLSGKSIATVINFAAHPTTHPAEILKFSADYVGSLKREVEKAVGGRAIFFNGAAGDQSADQSTRKGPDAFGQALGREAANLAASLKPTGVLSPSIIVHEERFTFNARTDLSNPVVRKLYENAFFPELIPNFIDEYAQGVRPRLTVALLGNEIALVGASGEFFSNHAIRLKERTRVRQLFFIGYCNGYHQYFPTIEGVAEGGYGADNQVSPVAIGAGEQMMNTALLWIYQMLGKIK